MDAGRALPREHQSPLSGRLIAAALIVTATAIPASADVTLQTKNRFGCWESFTDAEPATDGCDPSGPAVDRDSQETGRPVTRLLDHLFNRARVQDSSPIERARALRCGLSQIRDTADV